MVQQGFGMEVVARIVLRVEKGGDRCWELDEEREEGQCRLGWRSIARGQSKAVKLVVHR